LNNGTGTPFFRTQNVQKLHDYEKPISNPVTPGHHLATKQGKHLPGTILEQPRLPSRGDLPQGMGESQSEIIRDANSHSFLQEGGVS